MATIDGMAIEISRPFYRLAAEFFGSRPAIIQKQFSFILDNFPLFFRCPVYLVAIASERRHGNVCLNVESEFAVSVVYRLHGDA